MKVKIEQFKTTNQSNRGTWKPDRIVWHIAEGTYSGTIGWEQNPNSDVSSHFVLGKDGRVAQVVPLEMAAWTQGLKPEQIQKATLAEARKRGVNPNLYSISIECEGFWKDTKGALSESALKSAIELTKHIVLEINRIYGVAIPIDREHIIGHCQLNPIGRPCCPGEKFPYDKIIAGAKGAAAPPPSNPPPVKPQPTTLYAVQVGAWNNKLSADQYAAKLEKLKIDGKAVQTIIVKK